MERWVQVWQITDEFGAPLTWRFPSQALLRLVEQSASNGQDLYNRDRDGVTTLLEPIPGRRRPHLALHTIRRINLPSEDAGGTIVDLTIDPNHGLAEGTHFLFCPRNVVICLYNHNGPRTGRLASWLEARTGLRVKFSPLYRTDTWAVIDEMERLTRLEITIPTDQVAALDPDPQFDRALLDALRASAGVSDGGLIHLVWSVGRGGHSVSQWRMRDLVRNLVGADKRGFKGVKVFGKMEGVLSPVPVDLLQDQLVTRREVEPEHERSRRLSSASAYEAMDETYEVFKSQIQEGVAQIDDVRPQLPRELLPRPDDDDS